MPKSSHTRISLAAVSILMVCTAFFAVGCGSEETTNPAPDYAKTLAGSPPPLADLHAQENELIDGGMDAFDSQMADLKGYPVVVNLWASWCHPCRAEFPHFQEVSSRMGKKVAFLGVDVNDSSDEAKDFLDTSPVPYPSFSDPDNEIADELGPPRGLPATAFFDSSGEQTYLKQGPYTSEEDLEADIRTYAIEGKSG